MRKSIVQFVITFFLLLPTVPATPETIQLTNERGTYMVRVRINNTITLPFVLDTGATNVVVTSDVVSTFLRSGTIKTSDFIETGTAVLADGSKIPSLRFILHELQIGNHVISNVAASVTPATGDPLLGQSFLSKLPAWTIDNGRHLLILHERGRPTTDEQEEVKSPTPPTSRPSSVQGNTVVPMVTSGTGFFVSADGFLATAASTVAGCLTSISVSGQDHIQHTSGIVALDWNLGLALLSIGDRTPGNFVVAGPEAARAGEGVSTLGLGVIPTEPLIGSPG